MDPLPPQADDVPWPTEQWPLATADTRVDRAAIERVFARLFAASAQVSTGETHALVLVHRGKLVAERYSEAHSRVSTFCSWFPNGPDAPAEIYPGLERSAEKGVSSTGLSVEEQWQPSVGTTVPGAGRRCTAQRRRATARGGLVCAAGLRGALTRLTGKRY